MVRPGCSTIASLVRGWFERGLTVPVGATDLAQAQNQMQLIGDSTGCYLEGAIPAIDTAVVTLSPLQLSNRCCPYPSPQPPAGLLIPRPDLLASFACKLLLYLTSLFI